MQLTGSCHHVYKPLEVGTEVTLFFFAQTEVQGMKQDDTQVRHQLQRKARGYFEQEPKQCIKGQVRHQLQRKARGYFEQEPKHCIKSQVRHQLQRKARGYFEQEPKHSTWRVKYDTSCKGKHVVTLNMNQNTLHEGSGTTLAAKESTRLLWIWTKIHCMMELVCKGWRRGKYHGGYRHCRLLSVRGVYCEGLHRTVTLRQLKV
jgi:hypothetical protein